MELKLPALSLIIAMLVVGGMFGTMNAKRRPLPLAAPEGMEVFSVSGYVVAVRPGAASDETVLTFRSGGGVSLAHLRRPVTHTERVLRGDLSAIQPMHLVRLRVFCPKVNDLGVKDAERGICDLASIDENRPY